jgi:hypothetical protein
VYFSNSTERVEKCASVRCCYFSCLMFSFSVIKDEVAMLTELSNRKYRPTSGLKIYGSKV